MTWLILASLMASPAEDCIQFARTVEIIDTMAPDKRAAIEADLAAQRIKGHNVAVTLKAINHLKAGGTKAGAWAQCDSY